MCSSDLFRKSGVEHVRLPNSPKGTQVLAHDELPLSLQRFSKVGTGLVTVKAKIAAPEIIFPPQGSKVELSLSADGAPLPLVLKIQGGKSPYRWIANGVPLPDAARKRTQSWIPDGAGFSKLTVIDANGAAASVNVFIE